MYLTIAIINNSGNVGKSTICDTLLYPRIPNAKKIKIETINSDGTDDKTISAENIQEVFDAIDVSDVALIDVGASNIEKFTYHLRKLKGTHEEIDYFFIPTTPKSKQQQDTLSTIETLLELGVEPDQIKVIFNFNNPNFSMGKLYSVIFESEFFSVLNLQDKNNIFTIDDNPVFDMLGELGVHFTELAEDTRDFKALIRATDDKNERTKLSHIRTAHRLAKGFVDELDLTFDRINDACNLLP